jgi:hypothetical protein
MIFRHNTHTTTSQLPNPSFAIAAATTTISTTKLNPIYDALDAHQFSIAIKLVAALPDSNILGKALLAHTCFQVRTTARSVNF